MDGLERRLERTSTELEPSSAFSDSSIDRSSTVVPFDRELRRATALQYAWACTETGLDRDLDGRTLQQQKLETLGQLTSGIAHDFNNLLGVISNLAEVIRFQPDPDGVEHLASKILAAAGRGTVLTRRLLAFSRPRELQMRRIGLAESLQGIEDLVRYSLVAGIDLRLEVASDPWDVNVDPSELQLAILNLAVNSRDAMSHGGTLTLSTCNTLLSANRSDALHLAPGEYAEIQVTDTGCGMSVDTLVRSFEPYFTTKAPDRGTGLGLSQVYAFARDVGGAVEAHSALGVGTTVALYLPRASAL